MLLAIQRLLALQSAPPVPIRAVEPAYSSFASDSSLPSHDLSVEAEAPASPACTRTRRHSRLAVRGACRAIDLLKHLHRMAGHGEPHDQTIDRPPDGADSSAVVKVLGWRRVESKARGHHLQYTILAASSLVPDAHAEEARMVAMPSMLSEARLVARRYRDFEKLRTRLLVRAKATATSALAVPALPSKVGAVGRSPMAIGNERQKALHRWLACVVSHPSLWCDDLRTFLGLQPREGERRPAGPSLHTRAPWPSSSSPCPSEVGTVSISRRATSSPNSSGIESPVPTRPPKRPCPSPAYLVEEEDAPATFAIDLAELELEAVETLEGMLIDL
jgi:hypothetical protein